MAHLILPSQVAYTEPKERFTKLLAKDFGFDLTDRISLIADVNHFKIKEDVSVYHQAKRNTANYIEVYWDGVWICDFTDKESTEVVRLRFLKEFLKVYEDDKVGLNTAKEIESNKAQDMIDAEIKRLKNEQSKSESDEIVKEVQIGLLEEKKKPKGRKKKTSDLVL